MNGNCPCEFKRVLRKRTRNALLNLLGFGIDRILGIAPINPLNGDIGQLIGASNPNGFIVDIGDGSDFTVVVKFFV